MRILADTHVFLWQFMDDPRFSGRLRKAMFDPANEIIVSDVSIWEVAIKVQCRKLDVMVASVEQEVAQQGYERLRIRQSHISAVATLPRHHGDPFDHLLIAQAQCENLAILTADDKFAHYPVRLALE